VASVPVPDPRTAVAAPLPPGEAAAGDQLARLWAAHTQAPFPAGFRGADVAGVELILLDADVAGLVQRDLAGGLDGRGVALLWACIADLDKAVPQIGDASCAAYFSRLRTIARLTAARHTPAAG
jgi:hypothetical protein